jgi:hypothetical protein
MKSCIIQLFIFSSLSQDSFFIVKFLRVHCDAHVCKCARK